MGELKPNLISREWQPRAVYRKLLPQVPTECEADFAPNRQWTAPVLKKLEPGSQEYERAVAIFKARGESQ